MKTLLFVAIAAILLYAQPTFAQPWQIAKGPLMTRWAKDVSPKNALPSHPKMIFNARDYGAKGDGVANDSAAIQLAIDAAIAAGAGRTVSIPAGKYYLGPVRDGRDKWSYFRIEGNPDHLTIEGAGADKTVLLTGGTSQPFAVRGASNLVIRGFSVD